MLYISAYPDSRYADDHAADLWPASAGQAAGILQSIFSLRTTLESRTLRPLRMTKMQSEIKTLEGLYAGTLSEIGDAFGVEAADTLSATLHTNVFTQHPEVPEWIFDLRKFVSSRPLTHYSSR